MRDGVSQCLSLRRAAVRRGPDHSGQDKPDPGPYSDGLCGGRCAAAGCGCVSVYRGLGRGGSHRAPDGLWLFAGEGRGQSGGGGRLAGGAHRRIDRHLRRYRRGGGAFPVGGAAGAAQRKTLTNTRWGYIMRP